MVRVEGGEVTVRPIAGTRPRGTTEVDDRALATELMADPKELAEHVMLLDLGRNDVGRVARIGSVAVTERLVIERYSHVMHLVSNVRGELAPGRDAFDALRSTFPAGTLSGAPKIRAMEIIEELEPVRRGVYGGAVGYFGFAGSMDTAITIRTALFRGERAYVQTGAGIVADSQPESEHRECVNKARAMIQAIRLAEGLR
jgi:anthranilate synthase component 1